MGHETQICPLASPDSRASEWLLRWRSIGGGTTIALDGSVHVWRLPTGLAGSINNSTASALLALLDAEIELRSAVSAAVHREGWALPKRQVLA